MEYGDRSDRNHKDLSKEKENKKILSLSEDEKREVCRLIKIGVCKELHQQKLLDDGQLNELLKKYDRS